MYSLLYTNEAKKQIKKLDTTFRAKLKKHIEAIGKDPTIGKPLMYALKGQYSYRVQNYRIIYRVFSEKVLVLILTVGHRKDIYKKRQRKTK